MSEIIQDLSLEDVLGDRFEDIVNILFKSVHCQMFVMVLKPVQRRILYAMYSSGNTHDKISVKVRKQSVMLLVNIITRRLLSVRSNGPFKSRLEVTTCLNRNAW